MYSREAASLPCFLLRSFLIESGSVGPVQVTSVQSGAVGMVRVRHVVSMRRHTWTLERSFRLLSGHPKGIGVLPSKLGRDIWIAVALVTLDSQGVKTTGVQQKKQVAGNTSGKSGSLSPSLLFSTTTRVSSSSVNPSRRDHRSVRLHDSDIEPSLCQSNICVNCFWIECCHARLRVLGSGTLRRVFANEI